MNKQELLRQADYTFQRGNRKLAKKYLSDLLAQYPNEEAAWMLLARVVVEKEHRIECYERVLRINPNNNEAKIGLIRIKSISETLPLRKNPQENPWQVINPTRSILRSVIICIVLLLALGTTTYAIARNNPESRVAKLLIPPTPTPLVQSLPADISAQTRANVDAKYPQYTPLVDALIGLAIKNAENGMDGAPERPGAEITAFDGAGEEAHKKLVNALPQPGALSSITLDEQQITSWLSMEMKNSPDLPLSDIQVYLRNDKIQIWSMVKGSTNSTSALIIGKLTFDSSGAPGVNIDSIQIGRQTMPAILLSQADSWINQMISEAIQKQVPGLEITNISINNGLITMSGMR
jgi:tetratricopeptide (TPR) repeat protein